MLETPLTSLESLEFHSCAFPFRNWCERIKCHFRGCLPVERDHWLAGKSALPVHMVCLQAGSDAHKARFAPAALCPALSLWLEEPGNICVALQGPSFWIVARGLEGRCLLRQGLKLFFPFPWRFRGRAGYLGSLILPFPAWSSPGHLMCPSTALQPCQLFPVVFLYT